MKPNKLNVKANRGTKRVGRGISAGGGKTAGRGTKGQSSRTGGKVRPGFEGGQNPLMQRLPKQRGFKSLQRTTTFTIYTSQLNDLSGKIDAPKLLESGLISSTHGRVKVILNGEVTKKLDLEVQGISKNAKAAIEAKGGSVKLVGIHRPVSKAKKDTK